MLLEKAWSKVYGGYLNTAGGLTREALRDSTGAPSITFFTCVDKNKNWQHLMEGTRNNFIMTAGTDDLC